MAVHSARPFRAGWITAAYCSCLLAGGVGWHSAARAQTPATSARPAQVEQWRGNTRLGAEPPPALPALPVAPPIEPVGAPLPPVRFEPPPLPMTAVPPQAVTPVAVKEPAPAGPAKLQELSQQLIRSTGKLAGDCQSALDTCATTLRASGERLAESLAAPAKAGREKAQQATTTLVVTSAPPAAGGVDRDDSLPWYKVVWLQVVVGGSALVVGPLMVALMLGLMLRRSGLQLRVEVVNSGYASGPGVAYGVSRIDTAAPDVTAQPVGRVGADLTGLAAVAAMEAAAPAEQAEPEPTAQPFDLGPSYEEERLAKEEALLQAERAILQEIFEENLKLQQEIRRHEEPEPVAHDPTNVVVEPIGYVTEDQDQAV